jgi:hypothetical protein
MKNEFVIAEVMPGQLNAMVKNVMGQMKINDPNEAVRRVNSGEWIVSKVAKSILRLISGGKKIVIRATKGERTIAQAKEVFTWGIDRDFTNWGLDVPGEAKSETPVEIHEMTEDGNFKTIFNSLGRNLDELCFSQEQVITFVEDNKEWLRKDGYATFFLIKKENEFCVADVDLSEGGSPLALVARFSDDGGWGGDDRRRVVVPQQTLES